MPFAKRLCVLLLLVFAVSPAFALRVKHSVASGFGRRAKRHKKAHKTTWFEYRVFLPSHQNLLAQNAAIDDLRLPRIPDDRTLKSLIAEEDLVPVTSNKYVRVSPRLEAKRRFCRPWVNAFLQELGREYYGEFGEPIQVNSAVRTVRTQMSLRRWNHNAAPWHGETASAHLAGVAVDLQRRGLTRNQIRFIQQKLLYLANLKMVVVEEELKQPCIHIVVTGEYPYPPPNVVFSRDQGGVNEINEVMGVQ